MNNENKRIQFGNRFLVSPDLVFEHNAWDNVDWDEDMENEAKLKVEINSSNKLSTIDQEKYEINANEFWDAFYEQHQNRFFKDRHWLFTEFPELGSNLIISHKLQDKDSLNNDKSISELNNYTNHNISLNSTSFTNKELSTNLISETNNNQNINNIENNKTFNKLENNSNSKKHIYSGKDSNFKIFEVGCGVGNTVFPILETNNDHNLFVYCCDLSSTAIQILKDNSLYEVNRCHAFVSDISNAESLLPFPHQSLDIIILIFVLSAINPKKMQFTLDRLTSYLKPGGIILFRDYGRYDLAQLRFKKGRCLDDNFYIRGDGTRVYFFTQEELKNLFEKSGLREIQNIVDRRLQVNRGRQLKMYRVWIQCKYQKPLE